MFDVIPFDEAKMITDFRKITSSDLVWADDPEEVLSDIRTVISLCEKDKQTEKELAVLNFLRYKFQEHALQCSNTVAIDRLRSA